MISQLKHNIEFKSQGAALLFLILLLLVGMLFSLLVGYLTGILIWGTSTAQAATNSGGTITDPETIGFMKTLQMINHAGTFLIPALVFRWFISQPPVWQVQVPYKNIVFWIFLITAINFSISPFISWIQEINLMMQLPESLSGLEQWMKGLEMRATSLTESFISGTTIAGLLANLMILAILPAVGEEFIFRGILQPGFTSILRNKHLAIVVTAILFSAMHMQFYGFIPRFLLGVLFGYFFVWTKNIWTSIWAHFLNNATAVIMAFLADKKVISIDYDKFGQTSGTFMVIASAFSLLLIILLYKSSDAFQQKDNSSA